MANDCIKMNGTVKEVNGSNYKVLLENGAMVLATLSGKMRLHHIQLLPNDSVEVELSIYDLTKGRVVRRK